MKFNDFKKGLFGLVLSTSLNFMGCQNEPNYEKVIVKDKYIQGMKVNFTEHKKDNWNWMQVELGDQLTDIWKKNGSELEWNKVYSKLPKYEEVDSIIVNGKPFSLREISSDSIKSVYSHLELKKASDLYHKVRTAIWTDKRNEYFKAMKHIDEGLEESIARIPEYEMDTSKTRAPLKDLTPKSKEVVPKYDKTPSPKAKSIDDKLIKKTNKMLRLIGTSSDSAEFYTDSVVQKLYDELTQARLNLSTSDSVIDERLEDCQARIEEMLESRH